MLRQLGASAVLTRARTVSLRSLDARGRACVALTTERALTPDQTFVERVDHLGSSVTFRPRGGPFVIGCTSSGVRSATTDAWCGHVVGEIRDGHLVDPRLDIACRTVGGAAAGTAIGSAWIEPVAHARWIVVRGRAIVQIYPVPIHPVPIHPVPIHAAAMSLPVRVTTLAVDVPTATAVFRVEQYDAAGTRVSEATVRTAVAG